jgi:hypothetical protein
MKCLAVLIALLLAGSMTTEERIAKNNAENP